MVMIMVAICLFLRFNDLNCMAVEHFIPKQIVFDPAGNVMGICLKVFGKADTDWVTLTLWTDDECPKFSPILLLLVYIHLTKIQGGFLSPSEGELLNPPSDGMFVKMISFLFFRLYDMAC